jgi:ribosome-associated protein
MDEILTKGIFRFARSTQHVRGIANNIKIEAKRLGMKVVGIEGTETGHWMLIDLHGIRYCV